MALETAVTPRTARFRPMNPCTQCGEAVLAPELSEHVSERCVRHLWACESCGYAFETTVLLPFH